MKALDKLYNWIGGVAAGDPRLFDDGDCARLREIAHEIESEIEERYMPLLLDADGVPIHPGDDLYDKDTDEHIPGEFVYGIGDKYVYIWHEGHNLYHGISGRYPDQFRHSPRTLEDVLHDFWEEWESHPIDAEWDVRLERLRESEAKYAEEIREMFGDDE